MYRSIKGCGWDYGYGYGYGDGYGDGYGYGVEVKGVSSKILSRNARTTRRTYPRTFISRYLLPYLFLCVASMSAMFGLKKCVHLTTLSSFLNEDTHSTIDRVTSFFQRSSAERRQCRTHKTDFEYMKDATRWTSPLPLQVGISKVHTAASQQ